MSQTLHALALLAALLVASARIPIFAQDGDWPQWRGPDRSNVSRETGLLQEWPTNGPPLVWRVTGLGQGITSISVARRRAFTVGNLGGSEFVLALDTKSGEKVWATRVGASIQENPLMRWLTQGAPTVDGDRLYTLTVQGELFCLGTGGGENIWQRSYAKDFGSRRPQWGFSDHPLVDGDKLICTPVGTNATMVALNKRTGQLLWKTTLEGRPIPGYASLVVSEAGGIRQYVAFLGHGLIGVAANDGRLLWSYDRPKAYTASSYTPLVRGDLLCSPNGYSGGIVLIRPVRDGNVFKVKQVYQQAGNFDAFQDSTALVGDHLYIVRSTGLPACIEFRTGQPVWDHRPSFGGKRAALSYADGRLYFRYANGTMALVEATPKGYNEKGAFQIPEHQQSIGVTFPVVAGGQLFLRDNDRLSCYDISSNALAVPRAEPRRVAVALTEKELGSSDLTAGPPRTGVDRAPDAVFVPTPHDVVAKMLELARVKTGNVLVDLGSGDGRIVIAAAKSYSCQAIGYEIDQRLVEVSREAIAREKLEPLARIEHEDIFTRDLGKADIVTVFLYPGLMERLIPQFNQLKPGSRIVSHQFEIPGVKPDQMIEMESKESGDKHRIFLWITPLKKD